MLQLQLQWLKVSREEFENCCDDGFIQPRGNFQNRERRVKAAKSEGDGERERKESSFKHGSDFGGTTVIVFGAE